MRLKYLNTTAVLLSLIVPTALADEINWKILDGPSITAALTGSTLVYPEEGGAKQEFESDGTTVYIENGPSFGRWRVTDNRYCSVWPPASHWVCYDVEQSTDSSRTRRATLKHSSDIGTPQ